MKILDADIQHFGKFHNAGFRFGSHINIIYGKNGAGKSTLHAFLRSMLFGMERGRGRAAHSDEYSRYLPWETSGSYGGSLRLEKDGSVYQFTRNFMDDPKQLALFDETRGKPLSLSQTGRSRLLNGLNEVTFDNVISIGQLCSETAPAMAAELNNYISNLHSTGSGNVDIEAAIRQLTAQKKQLAAQMTAIRQEDCDNLETHIQDLQLQIQQHTADGRITRLYQRREQLQKRLEEQKTVYDNLSGHVRIWEERLQQNGMESREQLEQVTAVASRAFSAYVRNRNAYRFSRSPLMRGALTLLSLILFAVSFCSLFMANTSFLKNSYTPVIIMVPLCIACFAAGRILWSVRSRGWLWNQAREQLQNIFSVFLDTREIQPQNFEHLKKRLADGIALFDKIERCKEHCAKLSAEISQLQSEENQVLRELEGLYKADWTSEQNRELLSQAVRQREAMQAQRQQNEAIQTEISAIELAVSTIRSITGDYHVSFVPRLNQSCSRILSSLTGGMYDSMTTDDTLRIFIKYQNRNLPLQALSRGTMEQVYLALRLALADCFWPQQPMPLFLDDSFALYDNERLEQALLWLAKYHTGQIFLFTCHDREENLLKMHNIEHTFLTIS